MQLDHYFLTITIHKCLLIHKKVTEKQFITNMTLLYET